jgi:hypothetical protein
MPMALQPNLTNQPVTESVSNRVRLSIRTFAANPEVSALESIRMPYNQLVGSASLHERTVLFGKFKDEVLGKQLPVDVLLPFAYFEPHHRLVSLAVKTYLESAMAGNADQLKPVAMLVAAIKSSIPVNPGALLAGIVQLGDRRFNAMARTARDVLDVQQIRMFARTQCTTITAASVEFHLDWLLHLHSVGGAESISYIASSLMLMTFHDETGIVMDCSRVPAHVAPQGHDNIKSYQNFEDYLSEVLPAMERIHSMSRHTRILGEMVLMWQNHCKEAFKLREIKSPGMVGIPVKLNSPSGF